MATSDPTWGELVMDGFVVGWTVSRRVGFADARWVVPHLLRFDGQTVPAETERYLRIRPLRRRVR